VGNTFLLATAHVNHMGATVLHRHPPAVISSRSSPTAVCLAGEGRTIVSPRVRAVQLRNLIEPLRSDLFLVLSPHRTDLTPTRLQAIEQHMDPASVVVARDEQMIDALRQVATEDVQEELDCAREQPLPKHEAVRDAAGWRSYFQLGPCCPQLSLALRHRVCMSLIERSEMARGGKYTYVVRSRPDIAIPCALPATVLQPNLVRYVVDFIAFMPRRAAAILLREVPLARRWNMTACFGYRDENAMGTCNFALAGRSGWKLDFLSAHVWVPEQRKYLEQDVVYPAREVPTEDVRGEERGEEQDIELFPYLPFGNVSWTEGPVLPNSALGPLCSLAPNRTSAMAHHHPHRAGYLK